MKIKLLLSIMFVAFSVTASYASFPVVKSEATTTTVSVDEQANITMTSPAAAAGKTMTTALLLWIFLGGFAAHRWYLGSPVGWNILFIVTLGGLGIWWIIDGIDIITEKYPGL